MMNSSVDDETIEKWSFRLRFRVRNPLNLDDREAEIDLAGRKAIVRSRSGNKLSSDPDVTIEIHGFDTEADARKFGGDVRTALMTAEMRRGSGIDPGDNRPSISFGDKVGQVLEADGGVMMPDVMACTFTRGQAGSSPHRDFQQSFRCEIRSNHSSAERTRFLMKS